MKWWIRALPTPKCRCGKPVTVTVMNSLNASCGEYCSRCGFREAARLNREELAREREARS